MKTIKAIETVYNGYRFRSRLEARWAVFFDRLRIKYEYEQEGLQIGSTRYLPDFWLPDLKRFVEVKPTWHESESLKKPKELASAGADVIVLGGNPWPNEFASFLSFNGELVCLGDTDFIFCDKCPLIVVATYHRGIFVNTIDIGEWPCDHDFSFAAETDAYVAARQARFGT